MDREWQNVILRMMKVAAFALALGVMGIVGLVWPRPETSAVEKRELTGFPAFSLASLWDGSYFSAIDTWYADTYPMREDLIAAHPHGGSGRPCRDRRRRGGEPAYPRAHGDSAARRHRP